MNRFFRFKKHETKHKFITRGLYFLKSGSYKGAFILNIKEFNTPVAKSILVFPDMIAASIPTSEVKTLFQQNGIEYVETIKTHVYEICKEQFKRLKSIDLSVNSSK